MTLNDPVPTGWLLPLVARMELPIWSQHAGHPIRKIHGSLYGGFEYHLPTGCWPDSTCPNDLPGYSIAKCRLGAAINVGSFDIQIT